MEIKQEKFSVHGIKFFVEADGREVGRAFLYILKNSHDQPFGFMEDVFVDESFRSQGLGRKLVEELIKTAKKNKCYKLVGTSRHERLKVHELYLKLGFKDWGKEFRMDLI